MNTAIIAAIFLAKRAGEALERARRAAKVECAKAIFGHIADRLAWALAADATEPVGNTPEEFGAFIKAEIARWAPVVKASGARPD